MKWQSFCCTWVLWSNHSCQKLPVLASRDSPPFPLCFCVSVFTWQPPDSSSAPGQPHGSPLALSCVSSSQELAAVPEKCHDIYIKHTAGAEAAPTDSSTPLLSRHYSWPLTSSNKDYCGFELAVSLLLCVCVCEREKERACACGRGMVCIGVIISGQWKNSMRTSTPHKAISLSTPAVRGVCVYICACLWVCVPLSLSLSLHGLWFLRSHTAWQHRSLTIHRPGKETQSVGV